MRTAQSFLNKDLLWQAEKYPSGKAEISSCSTATTNVHPSLLFDHLLLRSSVSRDHLHSASSIFVTAPLFFLYTFILYSYTESSDFSKKIVCLSI